MKNIPKYETLWKRSATGKVKSYKKEIKLTKLCCWRCHDYLPLERFPNESGYGSKAIRPVCDKHKSLTRKQARVQAQASRATRRTIEQQTFDYYGGYTCVDCGITDPYLLKLYHAQSKEQGKQCKIAACGKRYQYHNKLYYYWLKKHSYPVGHKQVVLCRVCQMKRDRHKKTKPIKKIRHKGVALTDRAKMLEMFGMTEVDIEK